MQISQFNKSQASNLQRIGRYPHTNSCELWEVRIHAEYTAPIGSLSQPDSVAFRHFPSRTYRSAGSGGRAYARMLMRYERMLMRYERMPFG